MANRRNVRGSRAQRSNAVRIIVGLIAVGLIAATVGAISLTADDPSSTTTTTTRPVALTKEAQELVDLLDRREGVTYHARYQGSSPDAGAIVLETWQAPPLVRQDSEVNTQNQLVRTSSFLLEDTEVRCTRLGEGPWTCREGPLGDRSAVDPLANIRSRLGEGEVTVSDAQIDDRPVRCYRFTIDGAVNELCVQPDNGIPVRVSAGGSELRLSSYEDSVDEAVFQPPAEPTEG